MDCSPIDAGALWSGTNKRHVSTGPLAHPFARSLAQHNLLRLRAPLRSLTRSLSSSWDSEWLDDYLLFFFSILSHSATEKQTAQTNQYSPTLVWLNLLGLVSTNQGWGETINSMNCQAVLLDNRKRVICHRNVDLHRLRGTQLNFIFWLFSSTFFLITRNQIADTLDFHGAITAKLHYRCLLCGGPIIWSKGWGVDGCPMTGGWD